MRLTYKRYDEYMPGWCRITYLCALMFIAAVAVFGREAISGIWEPLAYLFCLGYAVYLGKDSGWVTDELEVAVNEKKFAFSYDCVEYGRKKKKVVVFSGPELAVILTAEGVFLRGSGILIAGGRPKKIKSFLIPGVREEDFDRLQSYISDINLS